MTERETCGAHEMLVKAFDNLSKAFNDGTNRTIAKLDEVADKFAAGTERMHSIESLIQDLHGMVKEHERELSAIRQRHEQADKAQAELDQKKKTCIIERDSEVKKNVIGGLVKLAFVALCGIISIFSVSYSYFVSKELSKEREEIKAQQDYHKDR